MTSIWMKRCTDSDLEGLSRQQTASWCRIAICEELTSSIIDWLNIEYKEANNGELPEKCDKSQFEWNFKSWLRLNKCFTFFNVWIFNQSSSSQEFLICCQTILLIQTVTFYTNRSLLPGKDCSWQKLLCFVDFTTGSRTVTGNRNAKCRYEFLWQLQFAYDESRCYQVERIFICAVSSLL